MDEGVVRMACQMWSCVASIESLKAEIEGFKVANKIREENGLAPEFGKERFFEISKQMATLWAELSKM